MARYTVTKEGEVTVNGRRLNLDNRDDLVMLHRYIEDYLNAPSAIERTQPAFLSSNVEVRASPIKHIRVPLPGETSKDYLVKVLSNYPDGLYPQEIVEKMYEAGWNTESQNPPRIVRVIMYEDKETFHRLTNGKWAMLSTRRSLRTGRESLDEVATGASNT